jgi:chloramphenicol 3-O-phosphotransferase
MFLFPDMYEEAAAVLAGLPTHWVAAAPSPEQLRQHEQARGDRLPGFAEGQLQQMFTDLPFQLTIDTGRLTPQAAARRVLQWIE